MMERFGHKCIYIHAFGTREGKVRKTAGFSYEEGLRDAMLGTFGSRVGVLRERFGKP